MRNIAIFVCFILLTFGCKPKPKTYLIDQFTKDYLFFNKGAMWVYVDSQSMNMDTFTVAYNNRILDEDVFGAGDFYEDITIHASATDSTLGFKRFNYRMHGTLAGTFAEVVYTRSYRDFANSPLDAQLGSIDSSLTRSLSYLISLEIHETVYSDVLQGIYQWPSGTDTLYFAKNVGCVAYLSHSIGQSVRLFLISYKL